jgi:hypothetical protein
VNNYSLTPNNNKGPVIGCNDNKFLNNVVPTIRDESSKFLVIFYPQRQLKITKLRSHRFPKKKKITGKLNIVILKDKVPQQRIVQ